MAFTEFYCDPVNGSNLNSGSTTAAAAAYTATNGGWNSATGVFTPTSGNPSLSVNVGDFASVYTDGASSPTGFVARVTAVNATTVTLSTSAKSGTAPTTAGSGLTIKVGGAWKGPNAAEGFPFNFIANTLTDAAGDPYRVTLKNSATFSMTAAIVHSLAGPGRFEGMTTTPGDGGRATIDGGTVGASYVLLTVSGNDVATGNIICNHNGSSGSANLVSVSGRCFRAHGCVFANGKGTNLSVIAAQAGLFLAECEIYGAGGKGLDVGQFGVEADRCNFHDNGTDGARVETNTGCIDFSNCIFDSNGLYGLAVESAATIVSVKGCEFYNNTNHGIRLDEFVSAIYLHAENCNFIKNGGYGIGGAGGTNPVMGRIINCGFGSGSQANTSGTISSSIPGNLDQIGIITYASGVTPWNDPANGDFTITLAAARSVGRGTFTQTAPSYAGTVGYPDVGAAQHQNDTTTLLVSRVHTPVFF